MSKQEVFEFRGVDSLYVAEVLVDTDETYECETPVFLSPVAEIGKTTEISSEAHYYDNAPMVMINSEGSDKISITMAPPALDMLAKINGKSFDEESGMMIDGERQNKYFAIMYRTKGTDGKYRYVSRLKGTFSIPDETNSTENEGTDTTNTSIEFTGIHTTHKFEHAKLVNGVWEKGTAKGVVVDTRYDKVDVEHFFDDVYTPDTVKPVISD